MAFDTTNPMFAPENLLKMSAAMFAAPTFAQGLGGATDALSTSITAQKQQQKEADLRNKTAEMLAMNAPDIAENVRIGAMSATDGLRLYYEQKKAAADDAKPKYVTEGGKIIKIDPSTDKTSVLGDYSQPKRSAAYEDYLQQQADPAYAEYAKKNSKTGETFDERKRMAEELGITSDDPRYQPFVATGKFPREDQQQLTAVDKTAILAADEMVAVNKGAIDALKQARELSPKANAGWLSGTRATIGNNLPDWAVPDDYVSSPESSEATQNFDNAIVGQALTQLKAIFGGAPTEGERKILLDLQGSSNLQPAVREAIIDRAIAAAERRLAFNQQRADEMRGGTFYKAKDGQTTQPANTAGTTKTGITFSVDGP